MNVKSPTRTQALAHTRTCALSSSFYTGILGLFSYFNNFKHLTGSQYGSQYAKTAKLLGLFRTDGPKITLALGLTALYNKFNAGSRRTYWDPKNMILIAGQELHASLEAEKLARVKRNSIGFESNSLCALQQEQSARGIVGAELVKAIHGWGVRYDSGLQNFGIIRSSFELGGSFEAAATFAKEWVAEDPTRRYAWFR